MLDKSLLDDLQDDDDDLLAAANQLVFSSPTMTMSRAGPSSGASGSASAMSSSGSSSFYSASASASSISSRSLASGSACNGSHTRTGSGSSAGRGSGRGEVGSRSRGDSFTGRHARWSIHHSDTLDLAPSSSTSSAIGISSNVSTDSGQNTFSTTPSALFSASSSLSSMSTPQNYKNVKPLQDAFSSTGLASKKTRAVGKRPRASAPGSLPLSSVATPHKPMPDTPVKSKASRSQSFISLRNAPVHGLHYGMGQIGSSHDASSFARRHTRISTESSSHMRRAVSAGVVSTPPRSYEAAFNDNVEGTDDVGRFSRKFNVLSILGSGEFSEAVEVEDRASRLRYAVKRTKRPATGAKARLRRLEEVDILRELSRSRTSASGTVSAHPNIVSLIDAWEEAGHLFMQLELCPLGNFADFLEEHGITQGPLDEARLWKVLAELVHGLEHIHSNGILHLDLKPANVFITAFGSLKIGDFGLASRWPRSGAAEIVDGAGLVLGPDDDLDRVALELAEEIRSPNMDDLDLPRFGSVDGEREKRQAASAPSNHVPRALRRLTLEREGDREYLAPEIMSRGQYGKPADMFSLGITMLEAAANVDIPDNGDAYQKLRNDDFSDVDLSHLSEQLVDILTGRRGLLRSDPTQRPTAQDLELNEIVAQVRRWMDKGLTKAEERRFLAAATSRHGIGAVSTPALRDPSRSIHDGATSDPFDAPEAPRDDKGFVDPDDPPKTATRPFFDASAFTTPVNGFKVLFPPPASPFPTSKLSPISDAPSSHEKEAELVAASTPSTSALWRGAIVEEDVDAFMRAVLGTVATSADVGSSSVDDIEMSF